MSCTFYLLNGCERSNKYDNLPYMTASIFGVTIINSQINLTHYLYNFIFYNQKFYLEWQYFRIYKLKETQEIKRKCKEN